MKTFPLRPLPPVPLPPRALALLREAAEALAPLAAPAPVPSQLPAAHRRAAEVYPKLRILLQEYGAWVPPPASPYSPRLSAKDQ